MNAPWKQSSPRRLREPLQPSAALRRFSRPVLLPGSAPTARPTPVVTLAQSCLEGGIQIRDELPRILHCPEARFCVTPCVLRALKKLGRKFSGALHIAKTFPQVAGRFFWESPTVSRSDGLRSRRARPVCVFRGRVFEVDFCVFGPRKTLPAWKCLRRSAWARERVPQNAFLCRLVTLQASHKPALLRRRAPCRWRPTSQGSNRAPGV